MLREEGLSFVEAYLQVVRLVEELLVVDQEELPLLVEDHLCTPELEVAHVRMVEDLLVEDLLLEW